MKKTALLSAACAMMTLSAFAQDGFTITGKFPGLKAGSKVELVNIDGRQFDAWNRIEGTVSDGAFVIKGTVDKPTFCEVRISPLAEGEAEGVKDKLFPLMVENVAIETSAAHIDSVPPSFYFGTSGLHQLKNVTVKGGEAQKEYEQYQAAMFPYEEASKQAHYNLYWDKSDKSKEAKARLKEVYEAAGKAQDEAEYAFINEHPTYHISMLKWGQRLSEPFLYTNDELDAIWAKVSGNNSPARVAKVKAAIDKARKFVRGQQYADFPALDPEGKEGRFSDRLGKDRYTMVDFWASWCGPCRMAIPHVRELHEKYGDRLGIVAVSVDEDLEAWKLAMEQEKMTWPQMRVAKENFKDVTSAYNFSGIPFIVLIDPQGRIAFAGHDPVKVSEILSKVL